MLYRQLGRLGRWTWLVIAIVPWTWFIWRSWHALFDLLAIAFPIIAAGFICVAGYVAFRLREPLGAVAVVSVAILTYVSLAAPFSAESRGVPAPAMRFLATNLESYWFSDNDLSWHLETHPTDLVVASEMQRSHRDDLRERFEFNIDDVIIEQQFREPPDPDDESYRRYGFPSIGVYSNYPLTQLDDTTGIEDGLPGFRLRLDHPSGSIVVYALHVPKPSFRDGLYQVSFAEHRRMAERIAAAVEGEDLPVVVIGDLNMTDRGGSYGHLISSGLRDGMRSSITQQTSYKGFWWDLLRLRIDHILVSEELCTDAASFDRVRFTDHVIISADIGPCE